MLSVHMSPCFASFFIMMSLRMPFFCLKEHITSSVPIVGHWEEESSGCWGGFWGGKTEQSLLESESIGEAGVSQPSYFIAKVHSIYCFCAYICV